MTKRVIFIIIAHVFNSCPKVKLTNIENLHSRLLARLALNENIVMYILKGVMIYGLNILQFVYVTILFNKSIPFFLVN